MSSILKKILLVGCVLVLAACAHTNKPAGVNDANQSGVSTQGLGDDSELKSINNDVGPHEGLLGNRSFYFAFDKSAINPDDYPTLQAHAQYLISHKTARILLEGNTDSRGSHEYNIALGQRRANSVRNYLQMQGVPKNQIRTISYGAERPAALGHDEDSYRQNRRDDLRYLAK